MTVSSRAVRRLTHRNAARPAHDITRAMRPLAFTLGLLVVTLCLVGLGGVVHTTGSSLACPDWPLCNGEWMPAMVGGVEYEHSHRLLALAVALGVAALPFVVPAAHPRLRRLAWICVGTVVVQALLGAATVILRLPPPVSIAHLLTATGLVTMLTVIATRLRAPAILQVGPGFVRASNAALVLLALQIALGATVRHLWAMYACGDDPFGCAPALEGSAPAILQVTHRGLGYLVAAVVIALVLGAEHDASVSDAARRAARVPLVLVLVQIALGMSAIALASPIAVVTAHLVCAELLLVSLVVLRLRLVPAPRQIAEGTSAPSPVSAPSTP
jgi:heme A synthase